VVHGLLGQAEIAARTPPDLDRDERARRARIDGYQVQLIASDVDVPGQDRPARRRQSVGDEGLGKIS
jgi:hypothetical protein